MINTTIARVISTMEVILAAGREQGIFEGMQFLIYSLGEQIRDPETGQSLGELELVKGRVKVSHVQEKLSIATTIGRTVTEKLDVFASIASMAALTPREITKTVYPELKVEGAVSLNRDLTVRVGDLVRSIE